MTLKIILVYILLVPLIKATRVNPSVKVNKVEIKSVPVASNTSLIYDFANDIDYEEGSEYYRSLMCRGVSCMPAPEPAPGNPTCRPKYKPDNCCPSWICASDHQLQKDLFDKNKVWVHHDKVFDTVDEHPDENEETPPKTPSESGTPIADNERLEKYVAKGNLDNKQNKIFLNRMTPFKDLGREPSLNHKVFKEQDKRRNGKEYQAYKAPEAEGVGAQIERGMANGFDY